MPRYHDTQIGKPQGLYFTTYRLDGILESHSLSTCTMLPNPLQGLATFAIFVASSILFIRVLLTFCLLFKSFYTSEVMRRLIGVLLIPQLASFASANLLENRDLAAICKQAIVAPILKTLSASYSNQVAAYCTKNLPVETTTSVTTTFSTTVSQLSPVVTHQTTTVTQTR